MPMPLQRQKETYSAFSSQRHGARERRDRKVIPEVVADMLRGPRVTAGMMNTRQASPSIAPPSPAPESYWDQDSPEALDYGDDSYERYGLDSEHHIPESHMYEDPQYPGADDPSGFGFGGYDDYNRHSNENLPGDREWEDHTLHHMSSFTAARPHEADGPAPALFSPNLFTPKGPDPLSVLFGGESAPQEDTWVTG